MRWEGHRQSTNVEDRRGLGGGGGFRLGGGSIGIGTVAIALVAGWLFGINPLTLLGILDGGQPVVQQGPAPAPPANDARAAFVSTVLADTEDVWGALLAKQGGYRAPKLTLFTGAVQTACGQGQAAMGPFYCPADQKVYIDLGFFETMQRRLGAPGDFAQAYVISHEVGHHIQNLMGLTGKVEDARRRASPAQGNAMSVRLELQADCFAGVWTHHSQKGKGWLEQGDLEEAMNAAAAVGDDTLQRRSQGAVVPESFTHGTSAQRKSWFQRGQASGRPSDCDTFQERP
jgi:predicted metalloprotease